MGRLRLVVAALGVMASVEGCASMPRPQERAASPETLATLATAPQIIVVHYHDVRPEGEYPGAFLKSVSGALVARIKARFLGGVRERLSPTGVRDVTTPRFPYREPGVAVDEPSVARLQRTYRTGYVFDFYVPWRYIPSDGNVTVQARLVRLDDLAVLWARQCTFLPDSARADRCADDLVVDFLTGASS